MTVSAGLEVFGLISLRDGCETAGPAPLPTRPPVGRHPDSRATRRRFDTPDNQLSEPVVCRAELVLLKTQHTPRGVAAAVPGEVSREAACIVVVAVRLVQGAFGVGCRVCFVVGFWSSCLCLCC